MLCKNCPMFYYIHDVTPDMDEYDSYCAISGQNMNDDESCCRTNKYILKQNKDKWIKFWQDKENQYASKYYQADEDMQPLHHKLCNIFQKHNISCEDYIDIVNEINRIQEILRKFYLKEK